MLPFVLGQLWFFTFYTLYGYAYYSVRREKERRLIEQQNAELEKKTLRLEAKTARLEMDNARLHSEKLEAENKALHYELGFLRAQLNPHFIINTMSSFYRRAYQQDELLAEAISRFSDILTYTLGDHHQLVPLQQEFDNIENYITVHRLQHGERMVVEFSYSGSMDVLVPSALLLSFVENAFKYGHITDPTCPLCIALHLYEDDTLSFMARNRKRNNRLHRNSTGIGIAHTRTRLEHLYPDRFELHTHNGEDDFTVQLTITQVSRPVLTTPYITVAV